MSISRPLVKCTGRRMAVQLARVMPNWKTISCRNAVTTWPKPNSTAETLSSSLDVEKLITAELLIVNDCKNDDATIQMLTDERQTLADAAKREPLQLPLEQA